MSGNDRLRYTPGRGRRGHCFRDARCNASRVTRQCLALLRSRYSPRVRIGYGPTRVQHPEAQHDALEAAGCERIFIDHASGKLATRPELAGQGAAGRRTRRRPARRRQARPARPLARASDREIAADFGVTRDRVPRTEEDRDGCRSPRLRAGRRLERAPTAGWAHWRRATQRRSAAKAAIAPTLDDRVVADSIVSSATTWPSKAIVRRRRVRRVLLGGSDRPAAASCRGSEPIASKRSGTFEDLRQALAGPSGSVSAKRRRLPQSPAKGAVSAAPARGLLRLLKADTPRTAADASASAG